MRVTPTDVAARAPGAAPDMPQSVLQPAGSDRRALRFFLSNRMVAMGLLAILGLVGLLAGGAGPLARWLGLGELGQPGRWSATWPRTDVPMLYLDVAFQDAQSLQVQRQYALQTGVSVISARDVVSAALRLDQATLPAQLALQAGVVSRPEDDSWGFELSLPPDRPALGGQHLSLSRLSLYQLGLNENLRQEGILVLPLHIASVTLNGDALGSYGVWVKPQIEWPAQQGRQPGGCAYFDQTAYWQELQRQRPAERALASTDGTDCQVAAVRPWDGCEIDKDTLTLAMTNLRQVQSGERPPAEALDVERVGKLLALATLWQGGLPADWSGLAFYLNPATHRLEPLVVGNLATSQNVTGLRWPFCFDDPVLQRAYVQAIQNVSQPEYVQRRQETWRAALQPARQALGPAAGELDQVWGQLAERQAAMRRWLEPTTSISATWYVSTAGKLTPDALVEIRLANLLRAPVEVLGFDVGKSAFLAFDPAWLDQTETLSGAWEKDTPGALLDGSLILRAADGGQLRWLRLALPYTQVFAVERAIDEPVEIRIVTRLWGGQKRQSNPVDRQAENP